MFKERFLREKMRIHKQYITVFLILMVGGFLSTLLFLRERSNQENNRMNEFQIAASEHYAIFEQILNLDIKILDSLQGFYYSSKEVEREEFKMFTQIVLENKSGISALGWSPVITNEQRVEFENALINEGFKSFQIKEKDGSGQFIKAGTRDQYFPVMYIEPFKDNEAAFGFDLGSELVRREALQKVQDSGKLNITGRVKLVQQNKEGYAVLAYLPIYEHDDFLKNNEGRRGSLKGFISGVIRMSDIFDNNQRHISHTNVNMSIFDITKNEKPELLYADYDESPLHSSGVMRDLDLDMEDFKNRSDLIKINMEIGERSWMIIFEPAKEFIRKFKNYDPQIVFIFGWIITLIFCFWLLYRAKYTTQIENEIKVRKRIDLNLQKALKQTTDLKFAMDEHSIVATTDKKGIITYVNDQFCAISKYSRDELIGQDHRIINSGYHPKEFIRDLWRTITSGKVWQGEIKNKAKDGSFYWVDTTIVPFFDEQGKPHQFIAIRTDITESKLNQESLLKERQLALQLGREAQAAAEAKSEFMANMSHEIRTPMNAVVGFCELLQKTPLDKTQKKYVDVLQSSGQLLTSVINDILDFSKLESEGVTLESVDFNLPYLVKDTLNIISTRVNLKTVEIYSDIDQKILQDLKGDPTKLRQILLNLLSNALKFTSDGKVGIIVRKEDGGSGDEINLRFTVKDTGVGIPKDSLENIFEAFHQADTSTKRKYGGTGLGLSITKSFVEAMGGKIWVESEEGRGSEFIFTIPLREGLSAGQKEIYPVKNKNIEGLKVFIVEDDQLSRIILKNFCDSLKIKVVAVEGSGMAALEKLDQLRLQKALPDLILTDIRMEGMSGFEMVEKIRADERYAAIKIITLSSEAYPGQADKANAKGFDGYLSKPYNNPDLVRVLSAVLGDKREEGPIVTRHMAHELGCKGIKVLVAEDNEPNQMLMMEYSKELGCDINFAEDGQQAIHKLKEDNDYDLVLMDLHMPVLGGAEACQIIREEISKDIPIIALTAAILEEDRKNAEAAGMNDFLTKPIDFNDLREKIIKYGRKA